MQNPYVICIGEAMIELSLSNDAPDRARVGYAGDTLNTAIYLKRSLPEARVAYATKLGADRFSDQMRAMIRSEGLETDLILTSPDRTCGLYAISTDEVGERSFAYWRSASAARDLLTEPALDPATWAGAQMVYLSAISLAILPPPHRALLFDWIAAYRATGGTFAFDSNYRPALWESNAVAREVIATAWRLTDLGLPSVDDEMAIFGDAEEAAVLTRLKGYGLKSGALKRGAAGPMPLSGEAAPDFPPVTKVVDSTAAGDSFNAGYLASYLSGKDEAACLGAGHALASRVIGSHGAILPR